MLTAGLRLAGLILAGTMFAAGAADAQTIISTTRDYTVTWSAPPSMTPARSMRARMGATEFSDYGWSLNLYSNAADLAYNSGGG